MKTMKTMKTKKNQNQNYTLSYDVHTKNWYLIPENMLMHWESYINENIEDINKILFPEYAIEINRLTNLKITDFEVKDTINMVNENDLDYSKLKKMSTDYVKAVLNKEYIDEDFKHYFFEAVLKCFYGNNIFKKLNKIS